MPNFRFDEKCNFEENCVAFLEAIKTDDPEMATILRSNWDTLLTVFREGKTDSNARVEFNTNVAASLDAKAYIDLATGGDK